MEREIILVSRWLGYLGIQEFESEGKEAAGAFVVQDKLEDRKTLWSMRYLPPRLVIEMNLFAFPGFMNHHSEFLWKTTP